MDRLNEIIIKHKKIVILLFLLITFGFGLCIPSVNVNYNLSKYLPKESHTTRAIDIMEKEFGNIGTAEAMAKVSDYEEAIHYRDEISKIDGIAKVAFADDFHILYAAAQTYEFAGLEHPDKKQYLYRAIELLERTIVLLSQNNDPEVSEVSIKKEIALCYITLGNNKKGIDILKKFNVCGIYDPLIAITYTQNKEFDNKEAEPYITSAFRTILVNAISTMSAFANYFYKKADYLSSRESLVWLIDMLQNTKTDKKAIAFFDKIIAPCYFQCANLSLLLDENEKIEKYLRMAYKTAEAFDNSPTFKMDNIKFNLEDTNKAIVYDNLGESAFASIEKLISEDIKNKDLIKTWKKIVEEHALEVNNEK